MPSPSRSSYHPPPAASHLLPEHATVLAQVQKAREAWKTRRDPVTAAPLYLRILQRVPELLAELEVELVESMSAYADALLKQNKATSRASALWLMDNACRSLPTSGLLAFEYGRICFQAQEYVSALEAFRRALHIRPRHLAALDALENLKNLALDRWHFRMLNDRSRNASYQRAIFSCIREQARRLGRAPRVLDVGTGTGLLAWMALKGGAGDVVACEVNSVLSAIASGLLDREKGRVQVLNLSSYDLHLDPPADVIVTELVDSGLLGEHILPVLRHARQHLLRQGGRILPHAARVHVTVVESVDIRHRASLDEEVRLALGGNANDGDDDMEHRSTGIHSKGSSDSDGDSTIPDVRAEEGYTCESIARLPCLRLTRPVTMPEIALSDPPPRMETFSEASVIADIDLEVIEDGVADAVAVWFDLDLLPSNSESDRCAISTAPGRDGNGWDQGLYFLPKHLALRRGHVSRLQIALVKDQLSFRLNPTFTKPTKAENAKDASVVTSLCSSPSSERAATEPSVCLHSPPTVDMAEMDIAHMNDVHHHKVYQLAIAERAAAALRDNNSLTALIDWSGNLSVLGLLAARLRALEAVPVTILTGSKESAAALRALGRRSIYRHRHSGIYVISRSDENAGSALSSLISEVIFRCSKKDRSIIENGRPDTPHFHVLVIHDFVENTGWLRQGAVEELRLLHNLLRSRSGKLADPSGLSVTLMPAAISVFVQGIEAPVLLCQNCLVPENLLGFPAEEFLDGLGVRKFRELDLSCSEDYRPVTGITMAFRVDLEHVASAKDMDNTEPDTVSRAQIELPVLGGQEGATLHAIGFWFRLHLGPQNEKTDKSGICDAGICFDTGPSGFNQEKTSYRQGAILVGATPLVTGERVHLEVMWSIVRGIEIVLLGID
ncbi:hypothetical protein NSK_006984 [Nannochloropsis salina CCMP1776]|uniref:Protein arginine N-methyltransferase domain-containing protein n=1 Tax=Nannochloropsis salina CCMP1776 TaxID=1027361 RepID=A0A4D9CW40_9STRA|nr:hypothetical protein NSK_006984 [Nannochloropsis salina CCMP1776]|eukprot:TFJ81735.1 hypothetical protein NSK_006984 [Nannochloropsis salina CCMP1776]